MFGRKYGDGLVETYQMNDAEYAVLCQGTICGTARVVVDELRSEGKKVGLIKLKALRPLPSKELFEAAKNLRALGVIDRHISLGLEGAVASDVKNALYGSKVSVISYVGGLGGKDVNVDHFKNAFADLEGKRTGGWLM
jgi:pyruvate ferredoxin oxidoreductase alpha subunit